MAVPKPMRGAVGSYTGESTLYLMTSTGLSDDKGPSKLHIDFDKKPQYATVTYTWTYKGEEQEGTMVVAGDGEDNVEIGWSDNWHMRAGVMHLKGKVEDGEINCKGSYAAPPGPDWGWRITFSSTEGGLSMKMYNATPDGEEMIAVDGVYTKE